MDLITTGISVAVGKKVFGKTLDIISDDIAYLYKNGRDKILEKAKSKIDNIEDGRTANLRVTRDVFWNGSFTDETICSEYFGGILASSRSEDGSDDSAIYFSDIIKSMSSNQLLLHYVIYSTFNKIFVANSNKSNLSIGQERSFSKEKLYLSTGELLKIFNDFDFSRDLHALYAKSLIDQFQTGSHKLENGKELPYLRVSPKTLGVQLYAVAHNKLEEWRSFAISDYGVFKDIESPTLFGQNIHELIESTGIKFE